MINIDKLNSTIERLKGSALFYLFVSSKELFHTNFWYWLSTLDAYETAKLFTNDLTPITKIHFKREHYLSYKKNKAKCDIVIRDENSNLIVIENKVKDIAKAEQLERIKQSTNNSSIKFILTTLFQNNELNYDGWSIVTYENIVEQIESNKFTNNEFYIMLINEYKDLLKTLSELANLLKCTNNYDFAIAFDNDLFESLNSIKFWETYQKYRASHLTTLFANQYDNVIKTSYSINHQKATMSFFISINENYNFGIQIENNQYRKFISHKQKGDAESLANELCEKNVFFNSTLIYQSGKKFLKYGKDFKYQYTLISNISFEELFKKILNDIKWLKTNQKSISDVICH